MTTIPASTSPSLSTHLTALGMGIALLCGATVALIGGTGLALWIAGIH